MWLGRNIGANSASKTIYLDDVAIYEANTLVDFNPRSASSSKWYNAAIPALYSGTLQGGVTLSAGSTDYEVGAGEDRMFKFGETVLHGSNYFHIANVNWQSGNEFALRQNSSTGETSLNTVTGTQLKFRNNNSSMAYFESDGDLVLESGNKLGVGTVPGVPLHIKGAVTALGDSRYNVRIEDSTAIAAGVGGGIVFSGAYTGTTQTNFAAIWGEKEVATDGSHAGRLHMGARDGGTSGISSDLVIDSSGAVSLAKTLTVNRTTTGGRSIKINPLAGNESRVEFLEGGTPQWIIGNYGTTHSFVVGTGPNGNLLTPKLTIEKQGSIRVKADSATKLLIHGGGVDGTQVFTDSSPSGHTISYFGNTQWDDTKNKFASTSIKFDGTGDYLTTAASNFLSGNWTVECWFYYAASFPSTVEGLIALDYDGSGSSNNALNFGVTNGAMSLNASSDVSSGWNIASTTGGTVSANAWHHGAVVFNGSAYKVYLDGVVVITVTSSTAIASQNSSQIVIGTTADSSSGQSWNGYMDEIRVSGTARWTSDFTPPSCPYSTVNAGVDSSGESNGFFNVFEDIAATGIGSGDLLRYAGNVAIGATSSSERLKVVGASTDDPLHLQGDGPSGIKFTNNGTNFISYIRTYESGTLADNYMAFGVSTGNNTTSKQALRLTGEGLLNQLGNATVNSATVQGLQDGAAYDFDGTDDTIDLGPSNALVTGTNVTVAAWVKVNPGSSAEARVFQAQMAAGSTSYSLVVNSNNAVGAAGYVEMMAYNGSSRPRVTYDASLDDGNWHHIAFTTTASAQKLYVDGVEVNSGTNTFVNSSSADEAYIGSVNGASYWYSGQIRDVKIFPSALSAPDVRKLYSGENPKKNLTQGNLIAAGNSSDFTSGTGSWANIDSTLISHATDKLSVNQTVAYGSGYASGFSERTYLPVGGTGGSVAPLMKTGVEYVLEIDAWAASGTPSLFITISNSTAQQSIQLSTTKTTYRLTYAAYTNTNPYIVLAQDATSIYYVDNVKIYEASTLVDFNSQSASSGTWHNAAIPALYNGSLEGGVTLSAGNSYWNNIRQEGGTVLLSAAKTDDAKIKFLNQHSTTADAGISTWDDSTGTDILIGSNAYVNAAGSWKRFKETEESSFVYCRRAGEVYLGNGSSSANPTARLTIDAAGNTQVSGRLGVQMAPVSTVGLAVNDTGDYILGLYRSGTAEWFLKAYTSGTFALHENGTGDKLTIAAGGNATFANQLAVTNELTANGGIYVTAGTLKLDDIAESIDFVQSGAINFDSNNDQTGRVLTIGSGRAAGATGGTSHLSIDQSGVQNHFGNRILNSQTVNDLHRTAEPSLRFAWGVNKVVHIGTTTNYGQLNAWSFSVWIKFDHLNATGSNREGIIGSDYWSG